MNSAKETPNIYERPNHFVSLNTIREQDELCDVTIKVGNKEIRAHRLILAATINYFHRMFLGDFEERKKDVIPIDDISAENMEAIITFSYTGKIAFTKENAASLLKAVDYFELVDVKDKCMEFLESNIVIENVFDVSNVAKLLPGCSSLLERSKSFIRQNLQDVSLTDDYRSLDYELLESILSGMEDSNISPELIFEAIMRWLSEEVDSKMIHLSELLCHISLSDLKSEFLVTSLFKDEFRVSIGPKHSELVTEVLSTFNQLKINNVPKSGKTYIYAEGEAEGITCNFIEIYNFKAEEWNLTSFAQHATSRNGRIFAHKDKLYKFPLQLRNERATMSVCNFKDKVWIDTETVVPFDMSGCGAAVLDDCLYACGGISKSTDNYDVGKNDVWRFSFKTRTWQPVSPMKLKRAYPRTVSLQKFIYAIGGVTDTQKPYCTVIMMERYDPLTDEWTFVSEFDVEAKYYYNFGAVGLNDKIYLCGGVVDHNTTALFQAYDLKTNKWTKMASMNTARSRPSVVEYKGKIWAIGGIGTDGYKALSSVEVYDPVSDSWTYGKPMSKIRGLVEGCLFSTSSCEL